jgi:hypothetical protein
VTTTLENNEANKNLIEKAYAKTVFLHSNVPQSDAYKGKVITELKPNLFIFVLSINLKFVQK